MSIVCGQSLSCFSVLAGVGGIGRGVRGTWFIPSDSLRNPCQTPASRRRTRTWWRRWDAWWRLWSAGRVSDRTLCPPPSCSAAGTWPWGPWSRSPWTCSSCICLETLSPSSPSWWCAWWRGGPSRLSCPCQPVSTCPLHRLLRRSHPPQPILCPPAFKLLESSSQQWLQGLVYLVGNLLGSALAIYKCQSMGLLPTHSSDWLAFIEPPQVTFTPSPSWTFVLLQSSERLCSPQRMEIMGGGMVLWSPTTSPSQQRAPHHFIFHHVQNSCIHVWELILDLLGFPPVCFHANLLPFL